MTAVVTPPTSGSAPPPSPLSAGPSTRRRRMGSIGFRVFTYAALLLIVVPAAWILLGVLFKAAAHWRWDVLWTKLTPAGGGLRDQILGTLIPWLHRYVSRHWIGRKHVRAGLDRSVVGPVGGPKYLKHGLAFGDTQDQRLLLGWPADLDVLGEPDRAVSPLIEARVDPARPGVRVSDVNATGEVNRDVRGGDLDDNVVGVHKPMPHDSLVRFGELESFGDLRRGSHDAHVGKLGPRPEARLLYLLGVCAACRAVPVVAVDTADALDRRHLLDEGAPAMLNPDIALGAEYCDGPVD